MSLASLAELLDSLVEDGLAVISESHSAVIAFGLSADNAANLILHAGRASLSLEITDGEGTAFANDELSESFAPYNITIKKPVHGELCLITNTGFAAYLKEERVEKIWHVARLRHPIVTLGRIFLPWQKTEQFAPSPAMKNPRSLVKEASTSRIVTSDIRPWILKSDPATLICASSLVWVNACIHECLKCLPDEVDAIAEEIRFKGPPKRAVEFYKAPAEEGIDFLGFGYLQAAVSWIFELENQAEVRSLYLKSEVVRSGLPVKIDAVSFLQCLDSSLEGAKIAYAMSISELGKDTVKALADLKKSITEDTAKITDATRQTIGAIAAALAVGIGLLAARVGAKAPINVVGSVMIVVAVYVALIIVTGWNLIRLQRQLRHDWHPKIYRFLTDSEYSMMVNRPAATAEFAFAVCAISGGVIVTGLTSYICYLWITS